MSFPNIIFGREGAQYEVNAGEGENGRHPWGQRMMTPDGKLFRYAKAGATIAAGRLVQSEVPEANWDELAITAAAVGAKAISVTIGATAMDLNEAAQGYMNVEDDTGEGFAYRIADHLAIASAGVGTFNLEHGLRVALIAATTVSIIKNPYKDFIIHPSPPTAAVLGVTQRAVVDNDGCWLQTHGPCSVLTEGTLVIGKMVIPSVTTDGAVAPPLLTEGAPNTGGDQPTVGYVIEVAATTEHSPIYLVIG